jgi:hypothetical protein
MDAVTHVPAPINETVLDYAPGSPERAALEVALVELSGTKHDLPHTIGGVRVEGKGPRLEVRQPHAHAKVLGVTRGATKTEAAAAVDAAVAAAPAWRDMAFDDRAAILLKAADLLAGPWRAKINAATMLGQSKTAYQAEIDSGVRADRLLALQRPLRPADHRRAAAANSRGCGTARDYRSLEGFVYAVTPFNFTAIAGNLPTAPALMGNTVVWKPSHRSSSPPADDGAARGGRDAARRHQHGQRARARGLRGRPRAPRVRRAALHRVDRGVPGPVAADRREPHRVPALPADRRRDRWQGLRAGPPVRRPGRAAHRPDPRGLRVPGPEVLGRLTRLRAALAVEGHQDDLVDAHRRTVDGRRHRPVELHGRGHRRPRLRQAQGGHRPGPRDEPPRHRRPAAPTTTPSGWFVRPTIVESTDPSDRDVHHRVLRADPLGARLPRRQFAQGAGADGVGPRPTRSPARSSPRTARSSPTRCTALRFAAGNFYINDKPTGAVVGQQPFGGGRASGTNDKAGAAAEPAALDVGALDQGDLRAADPAHATRTWADHSDSLHSSHSQGVAGVQ